MDKVMLLTNREELTSLMNEIIQNIQNSKKDNSEISKRGSNEPLPSPKLLTINETCKILGVTRITLNTWKKRGRIPYYKIGGKVYFKEDEVHNALRGFNFSKLNNF